MLAYVIYALIAVVSIAFLADIARLRRTRRGRNKIADPADFPQTKFAADHPDAKRKTQAVDPRIDGSSEHGRPVNALPGRSPDPPHAARRPAVADEDVATLLDRVMPDSHVAETPAPSRSAGEFDSDKTNVYVRPQKEHEDESPARREGAALAAAHRVRLVSLSGHDKGTSFPIPAAGVVVGRHPACHIVIGDPRVSGRHAWLGIVKGKVILRDLKSTNGTLLNAHHNRIREDTELRSGDTIFLGGHGGVQFRLLID